MKISLLLKNVILMTLCAFLAFSQEPAGTPAALNAEAIKAYQAKDYARFLTLEKRALELQPANPRFVYNVACGEALRGNPREAVRKLDQLLDGNSIWTLNRITISPASVRHRSGMNSSCELRSFGNPSFTAL